MNSLNEEFLGRMKHLLGAEYEDFYNSLSCLDEKSIYINENKISVEDFLRVVDFDVSPIEYEKCGFYVDSEKRGRHPLSHAGAFYIQEPSAMFTVNAYKFKGDEIVLDMCSAPGGKTIQIANRIPNGVLISNEIVKNRSEILFSNVERMGLKNVIITNEKPENLVSAYANTFDVCLVDAPCSGEGMFRRGEEITNFYNANLPSMCKTRQLEILQQADKCLKKNGVLIYSTCTYSKEENEEVVSEFASAFGYKILNIDAPEYFNRGIDMTEAVRLYPHKVKGEGQFVALLIKNSNNDLSSKKVLSLKECEKSNKLLKEFTNLNKKSYVFKNFSYIIPDLSLIKKDINYVSVGTRVAEIKQNWIEPNHNLFTAFGRDFNRKINLKLNDENVKKYLKGETFSDENGDFYGAILIENCPVGGYKISKGKFKNLYPKGLRNFK